MSACDYEIIPGSYLPDEEELSPPSKAFKVVEFRLRLELLYLEFGAMADRSRASLGLRPGDDERESLVGMRSAETARSKELGGRELLRLDPGWKACGSSS